MAEKRVQELVPGVCRDPRPLVPPCPHLGGVDLKERVLRDRTSTQGVKTASEGKTVFLVEGDSGKYEVVAGPGLLPPCLARLIDVQRVQAQPPGSRKAAMKTAYAGLAPGCSDLELYTPPTALSQRQPAGPLATRCLTLLREGDPSSGDKWMTRPAVTACHPEPTTR